MQNSKLVLWEGQLPISSIRWIFDSNKKFTFSSKFRMGREKHWRQLTQTYPTLYDGKLLILQHYSIKNSVLILETRELRFSSLVYLMHLNYSLPESYGSLGFQVFVTHPAEDKFLIGKRSSSSEYKPGYYTIPGGMFEVRDIKDGLHTACLREIKEELFMDLNHSTLSLIAILHELNGFGVVLLFQCSLNEDLLLLESSEGYFRANEEWQDKRLYWLPFSEIPTLNKNKIMEGLLLYYNKSDLLSNSHR
jgi:ADP-ribose pyrophosphatase YjhB (NUDIX family)